MSEIVQTNDWIQTAVQLVILTIVMLRWLYLEFARINHRMEECAEMLVYIGLNQQLNDELDSKKMAISTLREENKHLQEELKKIKEITDQWT
jgi:predicted  nucleic acid-binding Zn-ribbon protein